MNLLKAIGKTLFQIGAFCFLIIFFSWLAVSTSDTTKAVFFLTLMASLLVYINYDEVSNK